MTHTSTFGSEMPLYFHTSTDIMAYGDAKDPSSMTEHCAIMEMEGCAYLTQAMEGRIQTQASPKARMVCREADERQLAC